MVGAGTAVQPLADGHDNAPPRSKPRRPTSIASSTMALKSHATGLKRKRMLFRIMYINDYRLRFRSLSQANALLSGGVAQERRRAINADDYSKEPHFLQGSP